MKKKTSMAYAGPADTSAILAALGGDPNLLVLFQKAMDRLAEDDAGLMAPCTSVTSQTSLSKLLK